MHEPEYIRQGTTAHPVIHQGGAAAAQCPRSSRPLELVLAAMCGLPTGVMSQEERSAAYHLLIDVAGIWIATYAVGWGDTEALIKEIRRATMVLGGTDPFAGFAGRRIVPHHDPAGNLEPVIEAVECALKDVMRAGFVGVKGKVGGVFYTVTCDPVLIHIDVHDKDGYLA